MSKTQTPAEIDTAIAEQQALVYSDQSRVEHYREVIERFGSSTGRDRDLDEAERKLSANTKALQIFEAQYTGWERYYLVTNANGHVHDSMHCSSCFPYTRYAWRTDLSGLSAEEVVKREAYRACSVCMPIAPAEQRAAYKRYTDEQRATRKAEQQAKKDAKAQRKYDRAVKLLAKVDKVYADAKAEGIDLKALPMSGEDSLYQFCYAFGKYEGRKPLQDSVVDVLLGDQQGQPRGYDNDDPRETIREWEAK